MVTIKAVLAMAIVACFLHGSSAEKTTGICSSGCDSACYQNSGCSPECGTYTCGNSDTSSMSTCGLMHAENGRSCSYECTTLMGQVAGTYVCDNMLGASSTLPSSILLAVATVLAACMMIFGL